MAFVGDCPLMEMKGLHKVKVRTEFEAQKLIDDLMEFVGGYDEKVSVFYDIKDNKRAMAHFTRQWGEPEIRVKSIRAREVGTLIHELAHYNCRGHNRVYKIEQQYLIRKYLEMKGVK